MSDDHWSPDEAARWARRRDQEERARKVRVRVFWWIAAAIVFTAFMLAVTVLLAQDNTEFVQRQAAEQGDAEAQYALGFMYATGEGVSKDEPEAVRWYRLAADQGYASAQYFLGVMYADGRGVSKDEAEAVRWYRLAADQGYASAQYFLGIMYADGRGVLKDEAEAVRWYRLAADQGYANAQLVLGIVYADGRGVSKDDSVLAHMWFNIAGANGNASARELLDIFERDMTRAEIRRATELARACMTSDYQDCEP